MLTQKCPQISEPVKLSAKASQASGVGDVVVKVVKPIDRMKNDKGKEDIIVSALDTQKSQDDGAFSGLVGKQIMSTEVLHTGADVG